MPSRPDPSSSPSPGVPISSPARAAEPGRSTPRRGAGRPVAQVGELRELFWHNVVREFLTNLSVLHAQKTASPTALEDDPFDGRLAIITTHGVRIAIGAIAPMFACGLNRSEADRDLSMDVECTVFQIETPEGEVFTLPVHEIRSFHALTSELIERIKAASQPGADEADQMPFGFAAFTSMAKSQRQPPLEITTIVGPDLEAPI